MGEFGNCIKYSVNNLSCFFASSSNNEISIFFSLTTERSLLNSNSLSFAFAFPMFLLASFLSANAFSAALIFVLRTSSRVNIWEEIFESLRNSILASNSSGFSRIKRISCMLFSCCLIVFIVMHYFLVKVKY